MPLRANPNSVGDGFRMGAAAGAAPSDALDSFYGSNDTNRLEGYSERCLRRVRRVQHFSWWMTSMLHRPPGQDPFEAQLQRSQLDYVCSSRAASTTLAENYVGLERV